MRATFPAGNPSFDRGVHRIRGRWGYSDWQSPQSSRRSEGERAAQVPAAGGCSREGSVLQIDPEEILARRRDPERFVLYVEGPRDREILRAWAYRLLPTLARRIIETAVILGGRQPQRAAEHFRRQGGTRSGMRALCVLDRDDGGLYQPSYDGEDGLEFFTWSRRHIESYLLVPSALRRALCLGDRASSLDRLLGKHLPAPGDEVAFGNVDAKRFLGPNGVLPRALGRPIPLGGVARATRETELHPDVHELFGRLRRLLAAVEPGARAR